MRNNENDKRDSRDGFSWCQPVSFYGVVVCDVDLKQ